MIVSLFLWVHALITFVPLSLPLIAFSQHKLSSIASPASNTHPQKLPSQVSKFLQNHPEWIFSVQLLAFQCVWNLENLSFLFSRNSPLKMLMQIVDFFSWTKYCCYLLVTNASVGSMKELDEAIFIWYNGFPVRNLHDDDESAHLHSRYNYFFSSYLDGW